MTPVSVYVFAPIRVLGAPCLMPQIISVEPSADQARQVARGVREVFACWAWIESAHQPAHVEMGR